MKKMFLHGTKAERTPQLQHLTKALDEWQVCVASYDAMRLEQKQLKKIEWSCVVVDEAHTLKRGKVMEALYGISSTFRIALCCYMEQLDSLHLYTLLHYSTQGGIDSNRDDEKSKKRKRSSNLSKIPQVDCSAAYQNFAQYYHANASQLPPFCHRFVLARRRQWERRDESEHKPGRKIENMREEVEMERGVVAEKEADKEKRVREEGAPAPGHFRIEEERALRRRKRASVAVSCPLSAVQNVRSAIDTFFLYFSKLSATSIPPFLTSRGG